VITAARWEQAVWLVEDVVKIHQELFKERATSRGCAHDRRMGAWQPLPAESATLVCEGDRAVAHDQAEHGEPPGAEDDIVPRQGHYIEISGERRTTNGQRGAADDADARDAFAVGYHSRETRSVL
jgi:hypothetical protein